jgi:bacterioferritin
MSTKNSKIIEALTGAYWKELETVVNYLANSVNMDGIRAEEVKKILAEEVTEEIGHAKMLAHRIKELDGVIEGSKGFRAEQKSLQPPKDTTDIRSVVQGVIDAETDAVERYRKLIQMSEGTDPVTQDLATQLLADEEKHLSIFKGFMKGLDKNQ